jgi:hypothetical protein
MKQFIWNLRCMLSTRKHRKWSNEYEWYKYLVITDIDGFFSRFRKRTDDEMPF